MLDDGSFRRQIKKNYGHIIKYVGRSIAEKFIYNGCNETLETIWTYN
jgi:hypothetical protein